MATPFVAGTVALMLDANAVPTHGYGSGSLGYSGDSDRWSLTVNSTAYPVAVTLIISSWSGGQPDFDVYVYDPSGRVVGSSEGTTRQDTVHFQPSATGTYTIEVYSYSGSGNYFLDVSWGE